MPDTGLGEQRPLPEADTYLVTTGEMAALAEESCARAEEEHGEAKEARRLAKQVADATTAACSTLSPAATAVGNPSDPEYRREV